MNRTRCSLQPPVITTVHTYSITQEQLTIWIHKACKRSSLNQLGTQAAYLQYAYIVNTEWQHTHVVLVHSVQQVQQC